MNKKTIIALLVGVAAVFGIYKFQSGDKAQQAGSDTIVLVQQFL